MHNPHHRGPARHARKFHHPKRADARGRELRIAGLRCGLALFLAGVGGMAADAATAISSLHITATVVARCAIEPIRSRDAVATRAPCAQGDDASTIAPPKPAVRFIREASGVIRKIVEF